MVAVKGLPAGPDGVGGAFRQDTEDDRTALWRGCGGVAGVLKGGALSVVAGQMALNVAALTVLCAEYDGSGNKLERGYIVWAPTSTQVGFGVASASARNDALVAAFVDTEEGAVGTGALAVGGHLVVVPGVSGTTTTRTDADIRAYLGRGGYVRLADVPIASGSTQINLAGATLAAPYNVADTDWIALPGVVATLRYRLKNGYVTVQVDGAATTTSGTVLTVSTTALPTWARPDVQMRSGGYFSGHPGVITVQADGVVTAVQSSGASRSSVAGVVSYPV